jgi:hypothetical protein
MSYFGTSGPKSDFNRSIGAGYVRRLNLQSQRNTRGIGSIGEAPLKLSTFNTSKAVKNTVDTQGVNIKDRLNDWYSGKMSDQYGDVNELFNKVNAWRDHETKVVAVRRAQKIDAEERHATFALNVTEMYRLDNIVQEQYLLVNRGVHEQGESDYNKVTQAIAEAKAMGPPFNKYIGNNFPDVKKVMLKEVERLRVKRDLARQEYNNATDVLDNVHMKGVEDWMVDGPLMRESKAAMVISPAMILLGIVGTVYAYEKYSSRGSRKATGNKSAAYAVFS